jgi:hypothetical protein
MVREPEGRWRLERRIPPFLLSSARSSPVHWSGSNAFAGARGVRVGHARPGWGDAAWAAALVLLVVGTFCVAYGRTSLAAWATPITYRGDSLFLAAYLKAARDGHVLPGASLVVPELNAPFEANWNDHPRTLRVVFLAAGLLSRASGLFVALNLLLLLAHVLAALCFYAVARYLGARREWAFAGGVAFGLSHFLFWRTLDHVDLALGWHLPLCVLVVTWAFGRRGIPLRSRRFLVAALVTVLTALHNPYYSCLYGQFLLFAAAAASVRGPGRARASAPLALAGLLVATFLLDNAGSLAYQWRHGPNVGAERPYGNLERFALKPLELVIPPPGFGLAGWGRVAHVHWERRLYRAEGGSPYLGIVGGATLAFLVVGAFVGALRRPAKAPPPAAVAVAWVLLYSVLGGVNQILGIFGFLWLRGTNRFSVWILALVLLFLVTRLRPRRGSVAAATLVAALAIADQVPLRASARALRETRTAVAGDEMFVRDLEKSLPGEAMLFMLPIVEFPEGRPVLGAAEYDHLRPYLFSTSLRFSFGTDKGRPRESWQLLTAARPPVLMIADLERYGFAGILLDRRAYPANGEVYLADLAAAGRPPTLAHPAGGYVLVPLRPGAAPTLPAPLPAPSSSP